MTDEFEIPAGFKYGVAGAAIKHSGRNDVGILMSDKPATCAAVFTKNKFSAAPVLHSRFILEHSAGSISGVIVNSGNANAATGETGMQNAKAMGGIAFEATDAKAPLLVCSTGTIGVQLPMEKVEMGIHAATSDLRAGAQAFQDFSDSILTTDTVRKIASASFTHDDKKVTITGCAKGSGMMHPNMATMLSFVVTDAEVNPTLLQQIFNRIIERTLNCITIDGDTSTNDTAILMANGASNVEILPDTPQLHPFESALTNVLTDLSRKLARDGEGATHLVEITVNGAETFADARQAALAVGNSPLVKTAIYGRDANWGRIACALGNSGIDFDPAKTDISLGDLPLMVDGVPQDFSEDLAKELLSKEEIYITADLKVGRESATVWTCDLSEKYIEINGSYRT